MACGLWLPDSDRVLPVHFEKKMTSPEDPNFDPDQRGTSGCMWVEITDDNGETEWIHFFGLSHTAAVEMSKTEKTPPWLITAANDAEPPVF
jgi:hypothetical protein